MQDETFIPADLLIIRTSDENGLCYVETSNLDGYIVPLFESERNLKTKMAPKELQQVQSPFSQVQGELLCDKPNHRIHKFAGTLFLDLHQIPVNNNNLLLRV